MSAIVPGGGVAHLSSRAALLDVIRGAGQISRADLARRTGLTGATVSTGVRRLIHDGLVIEVGRAVSTGGKPAVILSLDPNARYAVGIHLDQAGITYVLANLGGAVVGRWRRTGTAVAEPAAVVAGIADDLMTFLHRVGVDRALIVGLGVVFPGPLTSSTGMVLAPPVMRAWTDYPLADALHGATGLPVMLENDATGAAIGEYWAGTGQASLCFAALYMGTGLGAGVMVRGDVYRGASSNTGEVGHLCVALDGPPCWCGARGCVEALAGPAAVVAQARAEGVRLRGKGVAEDFRALSRAAVAGEEVPLRVIERSARYLSVAVQALANIMDLDRIVLTGPAFAHAGSLYVPTIVNQLTQSFFARATHPIDVVISANATEAAAVGGAALVFQSELAPRASSMAGVRAVPEARAVERRSS